MENTRKKLLEQWVEELPAKETQRLMVEFVEMLVEQELLSVGENGVPFHSHTGEYVTNYVSKNQTIIKVVRDLIDESRRLNDDFNFELANNTIDIANKLLTAFYYHEIQENDPRF